MTTSRFTFVVCLLTCFLNCSTCTEIKNITAKSGETVTLPCRGFSSSPVTDVEWIRPDLEQEGYFFLSQDGRYVPDHQHPYAKDWVELKDTDMKNGDASLILNHAMPVHSGTYECYVHQGGTNRKKRDASDKPISIINLTVEPEIINITAKSGETVTLPCRGFSSSPVTYVKWIRPEKEQAGDFYLWERRYFPDNQHPYAKGWMELKNAEMKDGDASLIVKPAMLVDSGTYECYVHQGTNRKKRDASDRPITIINLTVEPGHSEL